MARHGERRASPRRERASSLLVALGLLAFFAAWHAPGLFGGRAYAAEDTLAYFAPNRAVHHALAHAGDFSWWDPLPGLGQPRLANIQNGSFSPFSLLFYALPVQIAFRFHAFLVMTALGLWTFALFRARQLAPGPAAFGALAWCGMAAVTTHFQHPPVFETLVWLPAALWGWERFLATRSARFAIAAGLFVAFQAFGASPQYLVYNGLVMSVWIGEALWRRRHERLELVSCAAAAASIAVIGLGLGSWQLLPFAELARESHRELLSNPAAFGDLYRSTLPGVLRALAAEWFLIAEAPRLAPELPYRELPNLSLLTTALAVFALVWARPRPWLLAGAALAFLVGTLGSAGGVTTLLGWVVPFADRLRAPVRMIVPAGLLLAWLAALGLQRLPLRDALAQRVVSSVACLWVGLLAWTLVRPLDAWVDPAAYAVPATIAEAPGRVVVDAWKRPHTPLGAFNAGLAVGVPTLLQREVLIPARFFEGYYASQLGSLHDGRRVDAVIELAALPLLVPDAALLRSYGLRSIVRYDEAGPDLSLVEAPVARFRWIGSTRSASSREGLWRELRAGRWDPNETVFLREPLSPALSVDADGGGPVEIEVLRDTPDHQQLRVRTPGGLIVSSELLFPGWSVRVDDVPAEPVEVDLALRAVRVPPGEHRVEWRYRPTWLATAFAGTGLAFLAACGLALQARRRPRAGPGAHLAAGLSLPDAR